MTQKKLTVEDLEVKAGLKVFKGDDGVFYVNDGTGVYVAEIKEVTEIAYSKDPETNEDVMKTVKKKVVERALRGYKAGKYKAINQGAGRAVRRGYKKSSNKHYTKKLKKVRGKVLYGDTEITKWYNKVPLHTAISLSV